MEQQPLTPAQAELLKQGIEGLPFSEEFKALMVELGFNKLQQLSDYTISELEEFKGFNKLLIHEYGSFMVKNNLGELIDP